MNLRTFQVALFASITAVSGWALPQLQLDIVGGVYDTSTQTTVATSPTFTLRALSKSLGTTVTTTSANGTTTTTSNKYYISAAIEPLLPNAAMPDIGTVTIDGVNYSSTSNASAWKWGTPPVDSIFPDIPSHGQFPTYYLEIGFTFNPLETVAAYNVQDDSSAAGSLFYHDFAIDVTGLLASYTVHFDLYDDIVKEASKTKNGTTTTSTTYDTNFAPFSHDAESGYNVPDNATTLMLLGLGFGVIGMVAGRKGARRR